MGCGRQERLSRSNASKKREEGRPIWEKQSGLITGVSAHCALSPSRPKIKNPDAGPIKSTGMSGGNETIGRCIKGIGDLRHEITEREKKNGINNF